ncbi:DEAD/DEAH box helicase [Rhodococcus qingshengii]|uniref:DEAD/DEAH box helicase n=1 Tax=Rhodococcus qingshengii TaxID=334542 RepID=UPI00195A44E9|nr:DEAD/DEAH box helicase [Rhodococcus qingshengii]QXC45206.1 DEAD/DEAH box helicase family protein [Rhodococcus qingshengii]
MVFKSNPPTAAAFDDPEELYRSLSLTNSGPAALWAHQADVLRAWHDAHLDDADVALELPTGAGKTLVGGLIGDYRRRKHQERVAYLCPTRLLARQTSTKLSEYGIPNVLLIGEVSTWNRADRAKYETGRALAVSVYSHVFNSNPAIDSAQLLLLDDAHAGEGSVSSPWKFEVKRDPDAGAYMDLLSTLVDALDPIVVDRLRSPLADSDYHSTVYLASPVAVGQNLLEFERVLATMVAEKKVSKSAIHVWKLMQTHCGGCLVYVSYRQILVRPLIAPTYQHPAFDYALRRVYMSATLGSGGELERSFGRKKIKRIPVPKGWDRQGTGRRFFAFPGLTTDLSTDNAELAEFVSSSIKSAGRAIVLTPDTRTADAFAKTMIPDGFAVFRAEHVEDDMRVFVNSPSAVLLLNNRYDGIDLPDNDCRLVILAGLPANGDLQERFLHKSLGAVEVLQERIRARIAQGAGRATRSARDYAAVLVLSDDLTSYLTNVGTQRSFHPEIQAELSFGFDNSIETTSSELTSRLEAFYDHGVVWAGVDSQIVTDRDLKVRVEAIGTAAMQKSARHEVIANEALWVGDWQQALTSIKTILDSLSDERAPQRYAALWNYLGYYAAHALSKETGNSSLKTAAQTYYEAARVASRATSWFTHLHSPVDAAALSAAPASIDVVDLAALEGMRRHADLAGAGFEAAVANARTGLTGTESGPYEEGLVLMGKLAGATESYTYDDDDVQAAPDAVWIFPDRQWVVWEAKNMATNTGSVGANNVRQAGSHLTYVETERNSASPPDSLCLLDSPKPKVEPSARMVAASNVYLVRPTEVLGIFDRLVRAWRAARAVSVDLIDTTDLARAFNAEKALPSQWLPELRTKPIATE